MKMNIDRHAGSEGRRVLIIGTDGLRADCIDEDLMPTFSKLMKKGTLFSQYYAAYPPHTRVSMTTLTTGVYPGRHGITNNLMHIPGFHDDGLFQTGNDQHLLEYKSLMGEPLILRPTLGDRLHDQGKRLAVAASSSPGASLLWNLNHPYMVINASSAYSEPELMELHEKKLGPVAQEQSSVQRQRAMWATRALIDIHLKEPANQVMVLWLSEPDASQHDYGLGSPEAKEALQLVDHCVAEVLEAIDRFGMSEQIDLLLISDHGHSTVDAQGTLKEHVEHACRQLQLDSKFIVADTFIYKHPEQELDQDEVAELAAWLQRQKWCDLLFTGHPYFSDLPGVLPIETIMGPVNHSRVPLLAVSPKWSGETNEYGIPGMMKTLTSSVSLKTQHGSLSPYDLHAFCLGYGPSFAEGYISDVPCGLVDIAPTVCHIVGLSGQSGFDGRNLLEDHEPEVERTVVSDHANTGNGIRISKVNGTMYIQGTTSK